VIRSVIDDVTDRNRLKSGIEACEGRRGDFASELEMQLAGIAMVPEARQLMSDRLTEAWSDNRQLDATFEDFSKREIVIGGGFHAAVFAANRVRMGFPRPIVLEQGSAEQVGGAFAMSLNPVFRLNSRSRPGTAGFPDQDKALNELPGGLIQPSMLGSEEYSTNADMAWLIRLTLMQYAEVYPGVTVTRIGPAPFSGGSDKLLRLTTSAGEITPGRVIDARGMGTERRSKFRSDRVPTFGELMARMGGMFPLRGMRQVAVIGGGDAGKCAVESLLGLAPGNSSAIGLDYVQRVNWYTGGTIDGQTCSEYRDSQRGRYLRIAQYLEGNVSNPSTRLRVMGDARGYPAPLPDGVIVGDRTYDMAVECIGSDLPSIEVSGNALSYYPVQRESGRGTVLARQAAPYESYRVGPAAGISFSIAEVEAGIDAIPANRVAMFRLAPRTAALAVMLGGLEDKE
jgi:hypothetical protein